MEIYKEILTRALIRSGNMKITFEGVKIENPNQLVEGICCKTIERIQRVLDNDELEDFECIERIVQLLEGIGVECGSRHDFG